MAPSRAAAVGAAGRRVDTEEVRRRWEAMSKEQRREAVIFDDAVLVTRIRESVASLYQSQVMAKRLGMRDPSNGEPDLFVDSFFLKEVIDLPWKLETSDELPDAVLMDPDLQGSVMCCQDGMLAGNVDELFAHCKKALPDFLAVKTGRSPLPRARWKQLWGSNPTSVASLNRQLATLVEQALWAVGAKPAFDLRAQSDGDGGFACREDAESNVANADSTIDAWLGELEDEDRAATSKSKKKKKNKQGSQPTNPPNLLEVEPDVERPLAVIDDDAVSADADPSTGTPSSAQVLRQHYWMEKKTPRTPFSWCLPTALFPRGRWATSNEDVSGKSAVAIVRNTFIEIEEDDEAGCAGLLPQRLARSLSPTVRRTSSHGE